MRCPQCKAVVPDGATFCDRCDAILDQSFLEGGDRDAKTPIPAPAPRQPARPAPVPPVSAGRPGIRAVPPTAPPGTFETPVPGRAAPPSPAAKGESLAPQAEDALADVIAFLRTLGFGQKVSLGGAFGAFIFAFFPWAILPGEGSVSGLDLGSFVVVLLAGAIGTLVVLDHLGTAFVKNLRYYYSLIQVGLVALIVLFCLYRFIHPADITEDVKMLKSSGADVRSSIQIGLYLTFLAAVTAAVGLFLPKNRH